MWERTEAFGRVVFRLGVAIVVVLLLRCWSARPQPATPMTAGIDCVIQDLQEVQAELQLLEAQVRR